MNGFKPEQILIGMDGVGLGRNAMGCAATYARERKVLGCSSGQKQRIQHALSECCEVIERAFWMAIRAASLYVSIQPCGVYFFFFKQKTAYEMFAHGGKIREDGRMVHDMYLFEVKKPSESKEKFDDYK